MYTSTNTQSSICFFSRLLLLIIRFLLNYYDFLFALRIRYTHRNVLQKRVLIIAAVVFLIFTILLDSSESVDSDTSAYRTFKTTNTNYGTFGSFLL